MGSRFIARSSHGTTGERAEDAQAASSSSVDDDETSESTGSSPSDIMDGASSSEEEDVPVFQMSDLTAQLPFKRGLSKYFQGKSQSFSSLSDVRRLEDLAKPENKYKKKLNASKRYGGVFDCNRALFCAKTIAKKHQGAHLLH